MKSKNTRKSIIIITIGVIVAIGVYFGVSVYFNYNPLVICRGDKFTDACLASYAIDLGLNKKQFIDCIQTIKYRDQIATDNEIGVALGLNSAPNLYVGNFSDGDMFNGFFVPISSYTDVTNVATESINGGVVNAQATNYANVSKLVDQNIRSYLTSQGYKDAEFNAEYNKMKIEIDQYMRAFDMLNLKIARENIKGDKGNLVNFVYFVDYASDGTNGFYTTILNPLIKEFVDTGKASIVYKDFPITSPTGDSLRLANSVRCAGEQQKYFEYSNKIQAL